MFSTCLSAAVNVMKAVGCRFPRTEREAGARDEEWSISRGGLGSLPALPAAYNTSVIPEKECKDDR